uniref:Galectin n=1 Tax=Caenorhabditis japonica TaxID=281687 RepID=A0A8R1E2L2_CAEJA
MSHYTILTVALFCIVQLSSASTGYGVSTDDDYSPPKKYDEKEYGTSYDNGNSYGQVEYGNNQYHGDYDHEYKHRRYCGDLRSLHISGHTTTHVHISDTFDRHGRSYVQLSCKNNNRPYAIVAEKRGHDVEIDGITLKDKIVLSVGLNIDYVAECHRDRTVGKSVDGEKYSFRRITCLQLSNPSDVRAF